MPTAAAPTLIAVDIGNSRMKLGRFDRNRSKGGARASSSPAAALLPEPASSVEFSIDHQSGEFDAARLVSWCAENLEEDAAWLVGSVHRRAAERLTSVVRDWSQRGDLSCSVRHLTYRDLPLVVRVDEPARVGIDRLLATLAVNRLREPSRAAIVVDLGTAITVDRVEADGSFSGGAILPGIAMAARALHEHTDALPLVAIAALETPPDALGKSTTAAIEAGLFWGAVGAIRELVTRQLRGLSGRPEIFVTGGAAAHVVDALGLDAAVRHVPNLVLSGIALVDERNNH